MSNKASTPANASPLTVKEAEQPDIVKKIGNTTYRVKIHFSTTSTFLFRAVFGSLGRLFMVSRSVWVRMTLLAKVGSV